MKSIFVSHVFEDKPYLDKIRKWQKKGLLEDYTLTFETEDKRQDGKIAVKDHLKKKIEGCAVLLVLIGNDTHNHDWVKVEVELANNFNKRICCVRIPNTTGGRPPILSRKREIDFGLHQILKEIKS